MGGVVDAISSVGGDLIESVGSVAGDIVNTAGDIVDAAGGVVTSVVNSAIEDPIGTAVKVAAVATGNAELLPAISAGDVIAHGGNLEQAATAAGTTYVAQGVVDYASDYYYSPPAPPPSTPTPTPPAPSYDWYDAAPSYDWYDAGPAAVETPTPSPEPVVAKDVAGTSTPTDVTPTTDLGEITITAPRDTAPVWYDGGLPDNVIPVEDAVPSIVNPDVVTPDPGITTFDPGVVLPYIPAIVPTNPIVPSGPTQPPLTELPPTTWGQAKGLVNPGLNPGWITDVPQQYHGTSPVESEFYWGGHPYQSGTTFNKNLYQQVPEAPAQPWGLQDLYKPTDINEYLKSLAAGPVAPKTGV